VLGRQVKVRAASPLVLRLISLFKPDLHEFMPMVPTYAAPIRYDAGKLQGLLGQLPHTSYDKALEQTVKALTPSESNT
jgi:hypothetical protein